MHENVAIHLMEIRDTHIKSYGSETTSLYEPTELFRGIRCARERPTEMFNLLCRNIINDELS